MSSLTSYGIFGDVLKIWRAQNWINRTQSIRSQFTHNCLDTVLNIDETANFLKKFEKWNILKHLSRSNKVVLDWSDSVQFVWMSVLTGRAVVKLRKHRLLCIQRLWGAHRKIHLEFFFFCLFVFFRNLYFKSITAVIYTFLFFTNIYFPGLQLIYRRNIFC